MKNFDKLITIIGFIFFFSSCYVTSNIVGTYSSPKSRHKFIIHTDSTFEYSYNVGGFKDKVSFGRWTQIDKNTIVLNSQIQSNTIPLNINILPTDNKSSNIKVEIDVSGKNKKDYRCIPYIDGINYYPFLFPEKGNYDFESILSIKNIYFEIYKEPMILERFGVQREYNVLKTEIKEINSNVGDNISISIQLNDSLFSYRIFNNTILKFNGNKMAFKDPENKNKKSKLFIK
jgi:hypothetical protein